MFRQVLDEIRILDGPDAVADAFGAQVFDRAPDASGAVVLARVGGAAQPGRSRPVEPRNKWRGRVSFLHAAQAQGDDPVVPAFDSHPGRIVEPRQFGVVVAHQVEDPVDFAAE